MQVLAVATFQNHVCYGGLGLINAVKAVVSVHNRMIHSISENISYIIYIQDNNSTMQKNQYTKNVMDGTTGAPTLNATEQLRGIE
jgi:hypothetical protein